MGRILLPSLGRNLDMVVKRPTKRCTSLTFVGLYISIIALHFSGFSSIPRCVSINRKNFPLSTLNTHFSRLSPSLYFQRVANTLAKSFECCRWIGYLTTMSSMYTPTHLPIRWLNTLSISL